MNLRLMSKVLGLLFTLESVAMLTCGLFALIWGETEAKKALLYSGFSILLLGLLCTFLGKGKQEKIPKREGIIIVGLGWLLIALAGALPYLLNAPHLPFSDAFFESVSGFTTTGATVITDLEKWPNAILLWRSASQWLGGLGILVLFVAILSALGLGSKSLFRNESSFQTGEAGKARIRDTAILLWEIYLAMTFLCALGLHMLGLNWFEAVCHAMTTVATGGFSPHNESIGYYSSWATGRAIEGWFMLFMFLSSISFLLYIVAFRRNWQRIVREEEAKYYLGIIITTILGIGLINYFAQTGEAKETYFQALPDVAFTVISIISTTGFGTVDYLQWPVASLLLLSSIMLFGGCAGSTSGGIKINKLLVFTRSSYQEIVRAFRPNKQFRLQVNGNTIESHSRAQTILFISLYLLINLLSTLLIALMELPNNHDMSTLFSTALSCLANIGPGLGEVGPKENFAFFAQHTKIFLALLMVLGRLELFAILVLFVPAAWRKY